MDFTSILALGGYPCVVVRGRLVFVPTVKANVLAAVFPHTNRTLCFFLDTVHCSLQLHSALVVSTGTPAPNLPPWLVRRRRNTGAIRLLCRPRPPVPSCRSRRRPHQHVLRVPGVMPTRAMLTNAGHLSHAHARATSCRSSSTTARRGAPTRTRWPCAGA
jgi:hypothetical protein